MRVLLLIIIALFSGVAQADTVQRVIDGDTLDVLDSGGYIRRVRLRCIDAPERGQHPWGPQSGFNLASLAPIGSSVSLRNVGNGGFGRISAEIYRGSLNLNLAQVSSGNAFVYTRYLSGCDRGSYFRAEESAKQRRVGIWQVPHGIQKPWLFRKK